MMVILNVNKKDSPKFSPDIKEDKFGQVEYLRGCQSYHYFIVAAPRSLPRTVKRLPNLMLMSDFSNNNT